MKKNANWLLARTVCLLTATVLGTGPSSAQTALSADGIVQSTSGGLKFPDGSVQTAAATAGSAPVEDTGVDSTQCFDETGTNRNCTGTGEDGELQAGVTWPTPRFTGNSDGTVTDNLTGLMWLQDADCPGGQVDWQTALDWIKALNSSPVACTNYAPMTYTDWRLPNVRELSSLVDFGETSPALPAGHPFVNAQSTFYWSSTSSVANPANAWSMNFTTGRPSDGGDKDGFDNTVWPVRGGK